MNKTKRFFFGTVVALALLGVPGDLQADLIFLGNDPDEGVDPSAGAFGQFFVPEGAIVQLAPTGAGPTVWAKIITGGGIGGPNGTTLTSFGKALGVDDLDDPSDNETKTDNDEWAQFEFYSDAAATTPTTLLIDLAFKDFNKEGDAGIATTFDTDGSSVINGSHMFQDETGDSSGNGVTYIRSGHPSTLKDYLTFSQPAHIFRIQNDSTYVCTSSPDCRAGNGWKIAYFDPGDYVVLDADLACDLDGDSDCDLADLRMLYDNIAAGTADNGDIQPWLELAGTANDKDYRPGDVDLDGNVSGSDFTELAFQFGKTGLPDAYWEAGNFDGNEGGDFVVGGSDFTALAFNFGHTSVSAVPEPGACFMLLAALLGLFGLAGLRRQRPSSAVSGSVG